MTDMAVVARNVTKSVTRRGGAPIEILRNVNIDAAAGSMTAIVGPSGSGKSTLLYALAGLDKPTNGDIWLLGQQLARLSSRKLAVLQRDQVGFVFQQYNLITSLTALENVLLPQLLAHRSPDVASARSLLSDLGLHNETDAATTTLSSGQQQRVALARVLFKAPPVVFADEPTGALDTATGQLVMDRLRSLARAGSAVIVVTHDLEAAASADAVYMLRDGLIEARLERPTATELFERMRTSQVKRS